ncbi:hypothetical protein H9L19_04750 [Weissella diestrammenae]|uniref:Bacteriophage abortive infection AbiH n=1 Tax=Weissella diestrammenae TaxID=1162633 RepID=A0A7G9T3Q8_9LACO|nr:AbiH family protein [Weissella diestrammenae]MCM0582715.1 hypothetical protein [Weissella diestrammenae]QNN74733.1 hypothetical protein H9L19_04750 [Weissella diestrammenae]
MTAEKHELIVLGNGFDLRADLKSTYRDFINSLLIDENDLSHVSKQFTEIVRLYRTREHSQQQFNSAQTARAEQERKVNSYMKNGQDVQYNYRLALDHFIKSEDSAEAKLQSDADILTETIESFFKLVNDIIWNSETITPLKNIWILFMILQNENLSWFDFENKMGDLLIRNLSEVQIDKLKKGDPNLLRANKGLAFAISLIINRSPSIGDYPDFLIGLIAILEQRDDFSVSSGEVDKINEFLISELLVFEKMFSRYIAKISEESDYLEKSEGLLLQLITDFCIDDQVTIRTNILNFNYTLDESIKTKFNLDQIDAVRNIHGSVSKDENKSKIGRVIFGIGNDEIQSDSLEVAFTKSFRIMNSASIEKSLHSNILTDDISVVKFYGHSLGDTDFGYFYQIFDKIDIWNSDVKLIFYYSTYGDKTKEVREIEENHRITHLLQSYVSAKQDERFSKRIIERLILDNRLLIREIK